MNGITEDTVYGGKVTLFQPERGFRAGTDSLMLAASSTLRAGAHALEIGCGCGGAILPAAWRNPDARFTGLEVDPEMTALAKRGAMANGVAMHVRIETGEASAWVRERENMFDLVFSNPPYFQPGTIKPTGTEKETAYITPLTTDEWVKAMLHAAKPKAPVILIHRAAELATLLSALDRRAGEIAVLPIYSKPDEPAKRILVRARKGLRRGETRLLDPVWQYRKDGDITPFLESVRRGEAIEW